MNRASPLTAYADAMKDVAALPDDADVADEYQPLEALGWTERRRLGRRKSSHHYIHAIGGVAACGQGIPAAQAGRHYNAGGGTSCAYRYYRSWP